VFWLRDELVAVHRRDARPVRVIEQRLGEPPRTLVQRLPAGAGADAAYERMAPGVTERHTVERAAGEPDRSEAVEQRLQERRCGDRAARSLRGQRIEERAWARRIGENVALGGQRAAQTAQQRRATLEPE